MLQPVIHICIPCSPLVQKLSPARQNNPEKTATLVHPKVGNTTQPSWRGLPCKDLLSSCAWAISPAQVIDDIASIPLTL